MNARDAMIYIRVIPESSLQRLVQLKLATRDRQLTDLGRSVLEKTATEEQKKYLLQRARKLAGYLD